MTNPKNVLTVGKLVEFLKSVPAETEITFGSSKYRKRPLIFEIFKRRGENLLQIQLNELDKASDPESEFERRETAEYFLKNIKMYPPDTEITFGSSMDAVPLEFHDIKTIVAINLKQTEAPNWRVEGD